MTMKKCPSCGGGGSNGITGDCSKCGGSGEVDVAKAEREAVAAGYKKVSLPEKPSEAEVRVKAYADGFKAGWDAVDARIVSRIQELEAEDVEEPYNSVIVPLLTKLEEEMKSLVADSSLRSAIVWYLVDDFAVELSKEVLRGLLPDEKKEVK